MIIDILKSFNTRQEQVYTCTTDNGANMIKAIKLLNEQNEDSEDVEMTDKDIRETENLLITLDEIAAQMSSNETFIVTSNISNSQSLMMLFSNVK